jgi:hypothetical protein
VSPSAAELFGHLDAMTDERGLFEHAEFDRPRPEHGYCTDDNARMLVVTSREPDEGVPARLARVALGFVNLAMTSDGTVRNRMTPAGTFSDAPATGDWWGRAMWGLGAAAAHHDDPTVRAVAGTLFDIGGQQRSTWPRAMAFAALGAADLLAVAPDDEIARALLRDAVLTIGLPADHTWCWPEPVLTYANAALAEAVIGAGAALDDERILDDGLAMLGWLLDRWSRRGWLSVTGSEGDVGRGIAMSFDQQPIELSSLADACWRAYTLTSDTRWADGVLAAERWFEGDNDARAVVHHAWNGGAYDGLRRDGVNLNQGAESTLALVSTRQRARSLVGAHG